MGLAHASEAEPSRGGLVSLLAHDMRVPLGPLALATSSLAADPSLAGLAREYAQIAFAQGAKVGRLLSAALIASGRVPSQRVAPLSAVALTREAACAFQALGGSIEFAGASDATVLGDRTVLGDCLLNLIELAAGPAYRTNASIEVTGAQVVVAFECRDVDRCAEALIKDVPDDADAAFALAAIAVASSAGGHIELTDTEIALALPPAEAG